MAQAGPAWMAILMRAMLDRLLKLAARLRRKPVDGDLGLDVHALWEPSFRDHPQAKLGPVTLSWGCYAPCVRQQIFPEQARSAHPPRRG